VISVPSLVLLAVLPLMGYGWLRALLAGLGSRRLPRPGPQPPPTGGVGIRVIGIAVVSILGWIGFATLPGGLLSVLALFMGVASMSAAWVIHGVPGHERGLKYALFVPGVLLFSGALGLDRWLVQALDLQWTPLLVVPPIFATLGALVWILVVLQPDLPMRSPREYALVYRWYDRVTTLQGPDLGSILRFLPLHVSGIGPAFLLVRYAVRAKVRAEPFVYLRPFSGDGAPHVFTEVVAPALARRGAVIGLVRAKQGRNLLHRGVPQLWRADFTTTTDGEWPTWVLDTLSRAKAVILDVTDAGDGSGGLEWAIEQCALLVHPDRLLVLTGDGQTPLDPEVFPHLLVDRHRPEAARTVVAAYGAYVNGACGVVDPTPRRSTPHRSATDGLGIAAFVVLALASLGMRAL